MLETLHELLKKHEITIVPTWNAGLVRDGAQWWIGKRNQTKSGKEYYWATFGNWKLGVQETWKSSGDFNKEELAEIGRQNEKQQEELEAFKAQNEITVADSVEKAWNDYSTTGSTPYLDRKQLHGRLYGTRIRANPQGEPILIVPLRDVSGKLWNIQRIYAQKLSKGDKFFEEGGKIDGCFHLLQGNQNLTRLEDASALRPIHICEGFATAASIQLAIPDAIVVASFNANNLVSVAEKIHEKFPQAPIKICADNDAFTEIGGKLVNIGLVKAKKASRLTGARVVYPIFKNATVGFTDFNDLHNAEGIERVRETIETFAAVKQGEFKLYGKLLIPMEVGYKRNGDAEPPGEKQVADYLREFFDDSLIKQEKSVWHYTGTHWEELGQEGIDRIKQAISYACQHSLGSRELEAYYRTFLIHLPHVPKGVDLYQPNPFAANFRDKTLHLTTRADGVDEFHFVDHRREDFLTSVLPFDKPQESSAPEFQAMLNRLWLNDPEAPDKKRLVKQIMGSCLLQAFPIIAIFQGKPGSGKSTILKLMRRLLDSSNVSRVGPTDMHGFLMEGMISKLVNIDTDIDTTKPMSDSIIKKLIDREPIRINRKGKQVVDAFLPAVHLFACNMLPKTLDGASKAYQRRIKIIHTDNVIEDEIVDFDRKLIEKEAPGIIWFAYQGLLDLVEAKGKFVTPESSKKLVSQIELDSDIVGQFIQEVALGDGIFGTRAQQRLVLIPETERASYFAKDYVDRPQLWEIFSAWQDNAVKGNFALIGKIKFFERLSSMGFKVEQDKGTRHVIGLRLSAAGESIA